MQKRKYDGAIKTEYFIITDSNNKRFIKLRSID